MKIRFKLATELFVQAGCYWGIVGFGEHAQQMPITDWTAEITEQETYHTHKGDLITLHGVIRVSQRPEIPFTCTAEELYEPRGILKVVAKNAGALARCVRDGFADAIRDAVQEASNPTQIESWPTIGYIKDGVYLAGDYVITDGEFRDAEPLGIRHRPYESDPAVQRLCLRRRDDTECRDLLGHVLHEFAFVVDQRITLPILGHIFAAPHMSNRAMASKYGLCTLWVHGDSGTGKSELGRFAQCFYGDYPSQESLLSTSSTPNFLALAGHMFRDAVVTYDNVSRGNLPGNAWKSFEQIIQDAYSRTARGRLTGDIDIRQPFPVRGLPVVTAEEPPTSPAVVGRSLVLAMGDPQKNPEKYHACLDRCRDYSAVMAHYIAFVQRNYTPEDLRRKADAYQFENFGGGVSDNADRLTQNAAVNRLGFCLLIEFASSRDVIDAADAELLLGHHEVVLMELMQATRQASIEEKPGEKFVALLSEAISSGAAHIHRGLNPENGELDAVGFAPSSDRIAIFPGAAYALVTRGVDFSHTRNVVGAQLKREGFLLRFDVDRTTTSFNYAGKDHRVWLFSADTFGFGHRVTEDNVGFDDEF